MATSLPGRKRNTSTGAKQVRKDQDLPTKLRIASALAADGYYVRINVGVSATSSRGLADVTELAARFINRAQAATLIPQLLQDKFWRVLGATGTPPRDDKNFLATEKLTEDLLDLLKTATGAGWTPKI